MPRKAKRTVETENDTFPTILRKLMDERELKQGEVAVGIGMTRQAISLYTTGQSTPDIITLSKMADFFGVSCDYLLGRTKAMNPDATIREMHEKTGLSEKAIRSLINSKEKCVAGVDRLRLINDLLEDVGAYYFLSGAYCDLKRHERLVSEVERIECDIPDSLEAKAAMDFKLFRCQSIFMHFLSKEGGT